LKKQGEAGEVGEAGEKNFLKGVQNGGVQEFRMRVRWGF
jgi:hypothetical protein